MAFEVTETLGVLQDDNRQRMTAELIKFNGSGNQALQISQTSATAEGVRHKNLILGMSAAYALLTVLEGYFRG